MTSISVIFCCAELYNHLTVIASLAYLTGAIFAANSTVRLHGNTVFEDNQALSG